MRKLLFTLILFVGLGPLALNTFLLTRDLGSDESRGEMIATVAITLALLAVMATIATLWISRVFEADVARLRGVLTRISRGDYGAWLRERGSHRETRALGSALNRIAGNLASEEDDLRREEAESRAVATQSLEFIEELLKARVPLAKHHPGLIESYSKELIARRRQAESQPEQRGFVRGVMDTVLGKDTREGLRRSYTRYSTRTLWVAGPVAARIIDLSVSGMCVESLESPQGQDPRTFTIVDGEERLQIQGTVQWCRLVATDRVLDGNRVSVYRAGIAFPEVLPFAVHEGLMETLDRQLGGTALSTG